MSCQKIVLGSAHNWVQGIKLVPLTTTKNFPPWVISSYKQLHLLGAAGKRVSLASVRQAYSVSTVLDDRYLTKTRNKVQSVYERHSISLDEIVREPQLLRALCQREKPLIHHAKASVVVDIRNKENDDSYWSSHSLSGTEALHHLENLIEVSYNGATVVKMQPHPEDIGYEEVPQERKREKSGLVGALSPDSLDWRAQKLDLSKLHVYYMGLGKSRLTGLVVATALAGAAIAPMPFDPVLVFLCSLGTGLTACAANAINQVLEVPYDSQMDRTKNRVLVRGNVTPLHAATFALVCATSGMSILYFGVNGISASLGALSILLYTSVYTPMKRMSITNTWVGSVVGAIPPMIGWAGCTGGLEAGAWIMGGILFAWQFPHFNALSWNLRPDYSRAGYRMMSVTNPGLCQRTSLRYCAALIGLSTLAPVLGVTTWTFAIDSLPLNGYFTYLAWKFYKEGDSKTSRKLFMFSLIHLPALMMLMIISKKHNQKDKETKE
ncbi:cytochrome c oxidase assembly factor 10 [Oratosquilla oratoria]|uniref:cytochrome c oxidase assembly factor 10 n=1 Tax=Oratosquilla oratoria TaxID=337810 RepID=UPI003F7701F0